MSKQLEIENETLDALKDAVSDSNNRELVISMINAAYTVGLCDGIDYAKKTINEVMGRS